MFDSIGNMPLHPLIIHAVVIGAPLCVLLALLFALPRTRAWARWPLAITALGTAGATYVSVQSGQGLQRALGITPGNEVGDLIATHSMLADQLLIIMIVFAVVAVLNALVVTRRAGVDPRLLDRLLPLLLLVGAVVVMIWTYRVGDIGSRAVWNPTGEMQY